jgi:acyl-CoA synthetase (AMP-forming)/AMP-acid ligase II
MNVSMLLELPATTAPDQPVLDDGDVALTYAELHDAVARTATYLRSLGVGAGDRVGIFATSSARFVEVLLATAAVEAVAVPMNYRARAEEVAHLLRDSAAKVVFADARYAGQLEAAPTLVVLDESFDAAIAAAEPADEWASGGGDAVLMYTSGTTALPKGVRLTHAGLTGFALNAGELADGSDRGSNLIAVPLYHVAGLTTLLVSLFTGRRTVLEREFTPAGWLDAVERERISEAFLVPTMLKRVLDEDVAARDLSSLRLLRYGAAPMPETVIERALAEFPPSTGFLGAYGLTETTSTVAVLTPEDHDLSGPDAELRRERLRSVGRVLEDVEVEIRDEDGEPLATGEVGRVCLRTARVMEGYEGGEARADDWFESGDLGWLDDGGYLFLTGRAGDMIIRGGENIAPQEVEDVLLAHPAVSEAAVVGKDDEEWGQRVVAAVVLAERAAATEEELIDHCRPLLAGFKRPEEVAFVASLPHTSTGKLMRRKVLARKG